MTALYIHIPFCQRKCNYCDFVSYAGKEGLIDGYVDALIRELESLRSTVHDPLSTIFFGGGTPTLLEPRHFGQIINTIICHLSLDIGHSELSVEANPGTADIKKLRALRQLGLNRLSIGVQSFNDQHLKTLGRIHDSATAKRFYQDARDAGFDNINLDLIFALPGQNLNEWKADLEQAIELKPEHLSTYNLQIEEGTPFYSAFRIPNSALPSEDEELSMYEHTIETLTANGYRHYEISNFAKPGFECQHNFVYWRNGNYLGVGAGAHSHINGQRWSNPNCVEEYIRDARRITLDETRLATDQRETLFLGLRL
jgi:oxygen-independent coproporphyrinogen-3 oxidase